MKKQTQHTLIKLVVTGVFLVMLLFLCGTSEEVHIAYTQITSVEIIVPENHQGGVRMECMLNGGQILRLRQVSEVELLAVGDCIEVYYLQKSLFGVCIINTPLLRKVELGFCEGINREGKRAFY